MSFSKEKCFRCKKEIGYRMLKLEQDICDACFNKIIARCTECNSINIRFSTVISKEEAKLRQLAPFLILKKYTLFAKYLCLDCKSTVYHPVLLYKQQSDAGVNHE